MGRIQTKYNSPCEVKNRGWQEKVRYENSPTVFKGIIKLLGKKSRTCKRILVSHSIWE